MSLDIEPVCVLKTVTAPLHQLCLGEMMMMMMMLAMEEKTKKRKEREAQKKQKKLLNVLDSSFRCETPVCHCDLLMHFAKTWPL